MHQGPPRRRPPNPLPLPRLLDALGFFWHLANFLAPALFVGGLCAALCKLLWRRSLAKAPWFTLAWQSSLAGLAVLILGLVATGHDGRMETYIGLVVVCALVPWWRTVRH